MDNGRQNAIAMFVWCFLAFTNAMALLEPRGMGRVLAVRCDDGEKKVPFSDASSMLYGVAFDLWADSGMGFDHANAMFRNEWSTHE